MFAILLHESMDPFYRNIASFPTALFTVLLAVCVLYWLCAVLGFVEGLLGLIFLFLIGLALRNRFRL